jgi:hypothetical protein
MGIMLLSYKWIDAATGSLLTVGMLDGTVFYDADDGDEKWASEA